MSSGHSKIIERQLLAAIEAFLKEKGVDTSEFARLSGSDPQQRGPQHRIRRDDQHR